MASDLTLAKRPGYGTQGRRVSLQTNLFEVKLASNLHVFLYAIILRGSSLALSKHQSKGLLTYLKERYPNDFAGNSVISDEQKMIYCAGESLPFNEKEFVLSIGPSEIHVCVKLVGSVTTRDVMSFCDAKTDSDCAVNPRDCIQVMKVALSHYAKTNLTSAGRGFFDGKTVYNISGGAEIWMGYRQSIKLSESKVFLNIDQAACAFLSPKSVAEHLQTTTGRSIEEWIKATKGNMAIELLRKLSSKVKGLVVEVCHLGRKRKYKCNKFVTETAIQYKFEHEGKEISVQDYFKSRFGILLKSPNFPLLHVGPPSKMILLPVELCNLAKGQRIRKLSPKQTADLIRVAAKKPVDRAKSVASAFDVILDKGCESVTKQFGMDISTKMERVEARILPPPNIVYQVKEKVSPKFGQWRAPTDNTKFTRPVSISKFAVISFEKEFKLKKREVQDVMKSMMKIGIESGVEFKQEDFYFAVADPSSYPSIKQSTELAVRNSGSDLDLIFFLLPTGNDIYKDVKRICDTELDLVSQCMVSEKFKKKNPTYLKNLLLKVNMKLGGVNWTIDRPKSWDFFMSKPAIIFGADVTHPSPGSQQPSIAAISASLDSCATRYCSSVRSQGCREEVITDIEDMTRELLLNFYIGTKGKKPERIIFYRDGVSEGQFDIVLQHEFSGIKTACMSLEEGYCPPITFVIAQKRHHVLFFPTNSKDIDKSGNIPAGTVVDRHITHPSQFDFYLCSHGGLQGTSKSCHYSVLCDENGFTSDALQEFTNSLCYLFGRCTRAVSLVTPTYYAHLAAFRARCHVSNQNDDDISVSSGDSTDSFSGDFPKMKPKISKSMYFM